MISGTGIHLDLEYCCGEIESISLFCTLDLEIDECCGDMKSDACSHSEEIISQQQLPEFQMTSSLNMEPVSLPLERPISVIHLEVIAPETHTQYTKDIGLPPPRVRFQQFLC